MSYSVDLWSSYNKVKRRLESDFKGLKDFIKLISEYQVILLTYATNLKRIYDMECSSQNESLQIGINSFKSDILNQIRSLNEFISSIKDDIIFPLNTLKEKILSKILKNLEETAKMERSYHSCVLGIESYKNNFYSSLKEIENYKMKYEITKRQNMEENNFQDYNVIESNEIKITTALKNAKEKEKIYINYIKDTNIMQEEYIEIKKKNLNQFQLIEEELGLNLKDSLRKYVIFKISYLRNLQYDLDKKSKLIENINIRNDILDFIFKNATNAIPPEKYNYSLYNCDLWKNYINYKLNKDKDIIKEVKAYINSSFNLKNAKEIMERKNENLINIENLANKAFSEKYFTFEEKRRIVNYSALKRSRRYLLNYLNKIRIKNRLNINEITFNNIGEILKQNIIGIEKENYLDFESYKLIIILSTSLYKNHFSQENRGKPRIFLQNYIKDCPIWKQFNFWEKIIQYEIIEEMSKQKKLNLLNLTKENKENKFKRIQLIAKSYLNSYLYHMISFHVNLNIINDIISFFSNYYFFEKTTIDFLNNILKAYKKEEIIISEEDSNKETSEINEVNEIKEEDNYFKLKQPLDNIIKAKQRREKSEEINYNINNINNINYNINNINYNDNDSLENLNINLINKDNNKFENEEIKNKKIYNEDYNEEDIKSQIAITECTYDKNDTLDTSIKEKSRLKIVNEDNN